MAVPKHDELMTPVVQQLSACEELSAKELRGRIAEALRLSPEDIAEILPSQTRTTLTNRIHWAVTYLKHAGLIEAPARGRYRLTARGSSALAESGGSITLEYLARFSEYRAFIGGSSSRRRKRAPAPAQAVPDAPAVDRRTPQDVLAEAVERLDEDLRGELLDEIMRRPPDFFERLVVDLLLRMGYGGALDDAGRVVGKAGDEGIDGIIQEDKLGFSRSSRRSAGRPRRASAARRFRNSPGRLRGRARIRACSSRRRGLRGRRSPFPRSSMPRGSCSPAAGSGSGG